jgi:hypothetical protein
MIRTTVIQVLTTTLFPPQEQYMLVHDALAEYIMGGGHTEFRDCNLSEYLRDLTETGDEQTDTALTRQYQVSNLGPHSTVPGERHSLK